MPLWKAEKLIALADQAQDRIEELLKEPKPDKELLQLLLSVCDKAALVQERVARAQAALRVLNTPTSRTAPTVRELEEAAALANKRAGR